MLELCRSALRLLGAALIIGLGFISGASAQSGNPIRIGMSLALTGAGASPSKVINTALDIWRDAARAQQRDARAPGDAPHLLAAFHRGLKDTGERRMSIIRANWTRP